MTDQLAKKQAISTFYILKKIWMFLLPKEKRSFAFIVSCLTMISIFEILTMVFISLLAKLLVAQDSGFDFPFIGIYKSTPTTIESLCVVVLVLYFIKNIVCCFEQLFSHNKVKEINLRFQKLFVEKFLNSDLQHLKTKNNSEYITLLNHDTDQAFTFGLTAFLNFLSEVFVLVFLLLAVLTFYTKETTITIIIFIIFSFFIKWFVLPFFLNLGDRMNFFANKSNQSAIQIFSAFKEILIYGKKTYFLGGFSKFANKKLSSRALYSSLNAMPRLVIETFFVAVFIGMVFFSFYLSETSDNSSLVSMLTMYLYLGFRLMPSLNRIISNLNTFKFGLSSTDKIFNTLNDLKKNSSKTSEDSFDFEKSILLKNVSFSYPGENRKILEKINVRVEKNTCIGFVGKTGSGKSTLIDIVLGFLLPQSGEILVDNQFPTKSTEWFKKIGYVAQSVVLLDDTIENNIAFGEPFLDAEKVKKCLEKAQLTELINSLPHKEKTFVGENGVRLSGGERQRIAIARALYRDPEVLIFDEATSALDNETEKKLMDTIYNVSKNRTVIMVAHRLSTLKKCDKIIVLDHGKVKEITTYDKLVRLMDMKET